MGETKELTAIYIERGLNPDLAEQVALQLMRHDALGAHARDELGLSSSCARATGAQEVIQMNNIILTQNRLIRRKRSTDQDWFVCASSIYALMKQGKFPTPYIYPWPQGCLD